MSPINERIALIVKSSGLSKTDFAQKIGISPSYMSHLTYGNCSPSNRVLGSICQAFDVDEAWVRTGAGSPFPGEAPAAPDAAETVAARIMTIMQSLGLSRIEFSRQVGLTPTYITSIFGGSRTPSDHILSDISRTFGVSRAWLATGLGEPFPQRRSDPPGSGPLPAVPIDAADDLSARLAAALSRLSAEDYRALARFLLALLDKAQQLPAVPEA